MKNNQQRRQGKSPFKAFLDTNSIQDSKIFFVGQPY